MQLLDNLKKCRTNGRGWKRSMRTSIALLMLSAVFSLSGCGGGGGAGGVTISGIATDDPVANATVSLYSTGGSLVTSTTTDASGSFAFSGVDLTALAQEYELVVTGGTILGAPFTGELRAIYGPQDNNSQANVTLVTTLIAGVAHANAAVPTSQGLFAERDAAIHKIESIGMVQAGQWSMASPPSIDISKLRVRVRSQGVAAWLNLMVSDLADNNLTVQNMDGFPRAHGGIMSVGLRGRGSFEAMQGETTQTPISTSGDPAYTYTYSLVTGPTGMQIDSQGILHYTIPATAVARSTIPFEIKVTNSANGLSRNLRSSIYVMQTDVIVSGLMGVQGGRITSPWNTAYIDVPLNTTNGPTTIELLRGTQADGRYTYKIQSSQPLNNSVDIMLPDPRVRELQLQQGTAATPAIRQKLNNIHTRARASGNGWTEIRIQGFPIHARFSTTLTDANNRVPNNLTTTPSDLVPISSEVSARLSRYDGVPATIPSRCATLPCNKVPVLFIHGYTTTVFSNSLGGGEGTWGKFPERLYNNGNVIPYEFDWATNARFQDAADDLAKALEYIAIETGQKVHIIAHSFGGILARTYLQKLATNGVYVGNNHHVASLMTVGTPHSGIEKVTKTVNGVLLPKGWDSPLVGCEQISCYQAGNGIVTPAKRTSYRVATEGAFITRLADLATYPLPTDVPIRVFIGLTIGNEKFEGGDKLISYDGQRFHPSLQGNLATDSNGGPISVTIPGQTSLTRLPNVTERILGLQNLTLGAATAIPGQLVTRPYMTQYSQQSNNPKGYYHTTGVNNRGSVKEVFVGNVGHDTFLAAKDWISQNTNSLLVPVAPTIQVHIRVFDGATPQPYAPLANATVGIYTDLHPLVAEKYGVTGALGNFTATVPFIANASYKAIVTNLSTGLSAESTITMQGSSAASSGEFGAVTLLTGIHTIIPPTASQLGDLSGTITDALNGTVLSGVSYQIFSDASRSTTPIRSGVTNASGLYNETGLVSGLYTIKLSKTGYTTTTIANYFVSGATSNVKNSGLSPVLSTGQMRIILNWGLNPTDLDSHLVKYNAAGVQQYHIFYAAMAGTGGDNLNLDDTTSYGPETVTIQAVDPTARYVYAVHNFSGGTTITGGSNANVTISGRQTPLYAPPTGAGPWWKVFEIVNGQVIPCNVAAGDICMFTTQTAAIRAFTPQPNWLKAMQKGITNIK